MRSIDHRQRSSEARTCPPVTQGSVHLIPCRMAMDLLGLKREDLDEPAGATMALAEAQGAITLLI
jgi:peroxiredoxin family protein